MRGVVVLFVGATVTAALLLYALVSTAAAVFAVVCGLLAIVFVLRLAGFYRVANDREHPYRPLALDLFALLRGRDRRDGS